MTNSLVSVLLNQGLDTVSPPLTAQPGALIDALNYEMTSTAGYRRIDGYERYDGWLNGDISEYYRVNVTVNDAAVVAALVPGAQIVNPGTTDPYVIGTVVAYSAGVLTYAAANQDLPLVVSGATLAVYPNTNVQLTATSTAVKGSAADSAQTFVDNIRSYTASLRSMVPATPAPVAGLHWMRHNLIAFIDTGVMTNIGLDLGAAPRVGQMIKQGTNIYRVLFVSVNGSTSPNTMTAYVQLLGQQAGSLANLSSWNRLDNSWTPISTGNAAISFTGSKYAAPYILYTPEQSYVRGFKPAELAQTFSFVNGRNYNGAPLKEGDVVTVTMGTTSATYTVISVSVTSGSFGGSNATGTMTVAGTSGALGYDWNPYHLNNGDTIQDSTGAAITVQSVLPTVAAGTVALRTFNTRYVARTHNFYANQSFEEAYFANGATTATFVRPPLLTLNRSLADPTGKPLTPPSIPAVLWGAIRTGSYDDRPKYVSVHANSKLALGMEGGSVMLSAAGQPHNFSGLAGAAEIATGDALTGMLESQEDSTVLFGKRGIRRLVGLASPSMKTIIPDAGCFDYTAVNVGSRPVFTGPAGISSLEQAQVYGDFQGARLSYKVQSLLVPEVVPDRSDSDIGGTAVALPVRSKDQYRLWLGSGKVYSVTFTEEGPKVMLLNYGVGNDVRVPFAWSSQLSATGKERIHVVWDIERSRRYVGASGTLGTLPAVDRIYELERGWGFDGVTFRHYFDTAHTFVNNGATFTGIEQVRMYGQSYGLATLDLKAAGIEQDFEQSYHTRVQDISLPEKLTKFTPSMRNVTNVVDHANWGLGIKLRVNGTTAEGLTTTEPSHVCQVLVLQIRSEGAIDSA